MWCLTSKKPWIILNKNIREEKMFRTITSHILYNGFLKCCTMDFKNFWNLKHVGKLNNTNVRVNQKYHFSSKSLWNRNQFSSVAQSCPTLCDPMNHSMSGLPVHHQLPEFTQTYVHWVGDAIQPSHPLSSSSPLAPNPSQHQSLFQWVNSSHEVA